MSEYIITTEQLNWFLERMDETVAIPAAIAHLKPIVRCRDCKYRYGCLHLVDNGDDDMRRCDATPDGFCVWGVRKEESE